KNKLQAHPSAGKIGIVHTRWATHGTPNDVNSHPNISESGEIALVHNGIIENYNSLKKQLKSKGRSFQSDTDTEVVAQLIEEIYENGNGDDITIETAGRLER